jgi:predicted phosphodiesterase/chorismate mutase
MDIFKQRKDESNLGWKHRLMIAKVDKEINISWDKLKDLLQLDMRTDYISKMAFAIHEYHKNADKTMREKAEIYVNELISQRVKEAEEAEYKSEKKKMQFFDQRRERNHIVRWEQRFEHFESEIIKSIENLAIERPIEWKQEDVTFNIVSSYREGALVISDLHKGLFAKNHWNTLNDEEFNRRMERLVKKTIEHSIEHGVRTLNVFGIGDFVNGLIHVTTRIANSEDVITQTMKVCEILSLVMARFSSIFDKVNYYHCRGNHDRVTANKKDELAKESFADFIPFYMKARLSHVKNFEIMENEIDDEIIIAKICGKTIFATHGHKDRIGSIVQNLALMTKIIPDYVLMGHYHHHEENEVQGVEVMINSSFSGVDDYAIDIRKTSHPAQKLLIFDNEEGRLCTYNIRLNI